MHRCRAHHSRRRHREHPLLPAPHLRACPSGRHHQRPYRPPLAWAYHDEITAAPANDRWRRGLSFFAALPAAATQSDAESHDATRTGGEPPEAPPTGTGSSGASVAARTLAALVIAVIAVIAVVGWFGVTGENIDRLDVRFVHAFDDTLGLTIMVVLTSAPLTALLWRRHWLGAGRAAEPDQA